MTVIPTGGHEHGVEMDKVCIWVKPLQGLLHYSQKVTVK